MKAKRGIIDWHPYEWKLCSCGVGPFRPGARDAGGYTRGQAWSNGFLLFCFYLKVATGHVSGGGLELPLFVLSSRLWASWMTSAN